MRPEKTHKEEEFFLSEKTSKEETHTSCGVSFPLRWLVTQSSAVFAESKVPPGE